MTLSIEQRDWLTKQAEKYHELGADLAGEYLAARGLPASLVSTYRLGVVTDPDPDHARYRGRLSIPYITPSGVVNFSFRCIQDHDCKAQEEADKAAGVKYPHKRYQALEETRNLYNVGALHERAPGIAIIEGEIDTMVVDTFIMPAVGSPGVKLWKKFYPRLFEDYDKVFVVAEGNEAGRSFAKATAKTIPNAVRVYLPDGFDANEVFQEKGEDALRHYILGEHG